MENKNMERLVKKAIKGNDDAFEQLIQLKLEAIVFNSLGILGQYQDAEDAAQEVVLKMHSAIKQLKDPSAFHAWVQKMVVNQCYTMRRGKSNTAETMGNEEIFMNIEENDREFLPQEFAENKEQRLLIRDIVKGLPEQKRMVITMYYYDQLSYKEIAEVLTLPLNTVATEIKRAKELIRRELEKTGEIKGSAVNKMAAIPVLSVILNEQAKEEVSQTTIANIMAQTQKAIGAKAVATKSAATSITKIAGVTVICTALITGITLLGIDKTSEKGLHVNQINAGSNEEMTTTQSAQSNKKREGGSINMSSNDCACGHVNPQKIKLGDIDSDYSKVTWQIVGKDTSKKYAGNGTTIKEEVKSLHKKKLDGKYTVTYTITYPEGNLKVFRDFIIDSGEIASGQYE